jgi:replicative DNA helicase
MSLDDPNPPESTLANVEAEAALLGALMVDNRQIDRAADKLKAEDFFEPVMGRIFSAIVAEHSRGRPANPVTLKPLLADDETLKVMGGTAYLAQLTGSGAALIGVAGFVEQVASLASRRRLITGLEEAISIAADPSSSVEKLIDVADAAIVEATHRGDPLHQVTAAECLDELFASYEHDQKGVVSTVIPTIDRLVGPMRPKQLVIGAARPGMGKTAVAISYALGAAQGGYGVLFISLEMGSAELGSRMASDLCFDGHRGIPYDCIRDGKLDSDQRRELHRARAMAAGLPFTVIDAGHMTIGRLSMLVRRYKRRFAAKGQSLDLVVVDYLQLMSPDGKSSNRNEAVGEISRGLKAIAKDQGVAMLALAQLSREVEKRADKRPQLSDLRESGQIEQDADAVLFLYRHEYYLRQSEPDENAPERADWEATLRDCAGRIDFICAKRRNGVTGNAQALFWGGNQAVRG